MSISFNPHQVFLLERAVTACCRLDSLHGMVDDETYEALITSRESIQMTLVIRAYGRFQKEMEWYSKFPVGQKPPGSLSAVRKYHRLLVDELSSYDGVLTRNS